MAKAFIKLAYRQTIDAGAATDFEKNVWHFSYEEYKLKSQAYNLDNTINRFSQLKEKDGRANSLHYKSGFAVGSFVENLKGKIPSLQDALGQSIHFDSWQFEVIESDITDKTLHKIAIVYTTSFFTIHQVIGETLLLSKEKNPEHGQYQNDETFMIALQPGLSIIQYQEINVMNLYA
jgi:hypothetical protein